MNDKVLKSSTIVPASLYVERDADRQVRKVISEMGRPGYVLVARQMGKTNLLINAKRKYENNEDIFVYIDLSNGYNTSRECFRSLIDTAIETHLDVFKPVIMSIYEARHKANLEPHQEHHRELRHLLRTISGKLVLILDEVDALTKTTYSDEIFAQIRSLYFSRVNFREAERLTYLLSGVAEPSELIKDKNISPFNIGQKIYLDDFTQDEYAQFVDQTKLDIPKSVVERVYYWSNGNPRITWDVCSELEDRLIEKQIIDCASVDKTIHKLYLNLFDRPPVDHIRSIVEKDKEIRNALVGFRENALSTVSNALKSKLYLAGIISGYLDGDNFVIKNRIIDMALSQKYLESVELVRRGALIVGHESFAMGDYAEALRCFNKYLEETELKDENCKSVIYFKMGSCSYCLNDKINAKHYLELSIQCSGHKPSDTYFEACYILGICNYYLSYISSAVDVFKIVVDAKRQDLTYLKALFALAFSKQFEVDSLEEAKTLFFTLLVDLKCQHHSSKDDREHKELFIAAKHSLGSIHLQENDYDAAQLAFAEATLMSPDNYKAEFFIAKIDALSEMQLRRS